jgi:hypothetical protein
MAAWLLETGVLELVSAVLITYLFLVRGRSWWAGPPLPVAVLTLDLVLIQGAGYWFLKLRSLRTRRPGRAGPRWRLRALQVLYAADVALLTAFPAVAALSGADDLSGLLLGAALWAFALAEFVHYFLWKINMRASERARPRRVPGRILRELRRARGAASAR